MVHFVLKIAFCTLSFVFFLSSPLPSPLLPHPGQNSAIFLKQIFSPLVYLTLVPVVAGVGIASLKELDFKVRRENYVVETLLHSREGRGGGIFRNNSNWRPRRKGGRMAGGVLYLAILR